MTELETYEWMLKYVILLQPDSLALTQLLNLETKIVNQDEMRVKKLL